MLKLVPGPLERVPATGCETTALLGGKFEGIVGRDACDGVIADLSGRTGGLRNMGAITGIVGNTVYGRVVYGYVWEGSKVVPRYESVLKGTIIESDEYEQLDTEGSKGIGKFTATSGTRYYKDLTLVEVRELPFQEPISRGESVPMQSQTVNAFIERTFPPYMTKEQFHRAERILDGLSPGTHWWDIAHALGADFHTADGGIIVVMAAAGYLNWKKGKYKFGEDNEHGMFAVYPFGYLEKDKEVPQLALILKNELLLMVVPYAKRQELKKHFK